MANQKNKKKWGQNNLLCSSFSFKNRKITRLIQRVILLVLYQNQIGKQSTTSAFECFYIFLLYQNQIGKQSTTDSDGFRERMHYIKTKLESNLQHPSFALDCGSYYIKTKLESNLQHAVGAMLFSLDYIKTKLESNLQPRALAVGVHNNYIKTKLESNLQHV